MAAEPLFVRANHLHPEAVHFERRYGRTARRGNANDADSGPAKVFDPPLSARMEERHDPSG
jgi:hypothetical protein